MKSYENVKSRQTPKLVNFILSNKRHKVCLCHFLAPGTHSKSAWLQNWVFILGISHILGNGDPLGFPGSKVVCLFFFFFASSVVGIKGRALC